ncbi:MAG: DUF4333 domain-containing protein [Thermoleophilaceae bacterium]
MKWLAAISLVLVIAGCGGTTIDGGELEDEIKEDAEGQGLVLDGVDCPSPDVEEGNTFTCTITIKGEPRDLEVTQTDDDGNVTYPRAGLEPEGPAVNDTAADKTSIEFVIDAVNKDITALCDYAVPKYRKEIAGEENCAKVVLDEYDELLGDYEISLEGDKAAASDGRRTVTLERQQDGSWLITDVR